MLIAISFFQPTKIILKVRCSKGGGVAIIVKGGMEFCVLRNCPNIEATRVTLLFFSSSVLVGAVYRPPGADVDVLNNLHGFLD